MINFIFKNNQLISANSLIISLDDRAFLFGDGFFETCHIYNGKIYNLSLHLKRIQKALKSLKFSIKIDNLPILCQELIEVNKIKEGILKIIFSRGVGSKGYLPNENIENYFIIKTENPRINLANISSDNPIYLGVSQQKLNNNSVISGLKTMQSMAYTLNKISALQQNFFDLIMLNNNFIAETSSANIFWTKNGEIFTPSKKCNLVIGTMRQKLLRLLQKHCIKFYEVEAKIDQIIAADEVFLTNASWLILSVDQITYGKKIKKYGKELSKKITKIILQDRSNECVAT